MSKDDKTEVADFLANLTEFIKPEHITMYSIQKDLKNLEARIEALREEHKECIDILKGLRKELQYNEVLISKLSSNYMDEEVAQATSTLNKISKNVDCTLMELPFITSEDESDSITEDSMTIDSLDNFNADINGESPTLSDIDLY